MDTGERVLRIDCDDCAMQGTAACADCVVTFLCCRDEDSAVVIDVAEVRALRLLRDAGLAPALRHQRRDAPAIEEDGSTRRMVRSR